MDKELFEVMVLFKKVVLFNELRFKRKELPEGLYCYDIREGGTNWFGSLADSVWIDHAGSVLCCEPFPPIKSCGVMLSTADEQPIRNRYNWTDEPPMSIEEYIKRYDELTKKYCG